MTDQSIGNADNCPKGSCIRHGECMYMNYPHCPVNRAPAREPTKASAEVEELAKRLQETLIAMAGFSGDIPLSVWRKHSKAVEEAAMKLRALDADKSRAKEIIASQATEAIGLVERIETLEAENARLREQNRNHRWNIREADGELLICDGLHDKGEPCEEIPWVPKSTMEAELARLQAPVTDAEVAGRSRALVMLAGSNADLTTDDRDSLHAAAVMIETLYRKQPAPVTDAEVAGLCAELRATNWSSGIQNKAADLIETLWRKQHEPVTGDRAELVAELRDIAHLEHQGRLNLDVSSYGVCHDTVEDQPTWKAADMLEADARRIATLQGEVEGLREIAHAAWHCLDDSDFDEFNECVMPHNAKRLNEAFDAYEARFPNWHEDYANNRDATPATLPPALADHIPDLGKMIDAAAIRAKFEAMMIGSGDARYTPDFRMGHDLAIDACLAFIDEE